MYAQVDITAPLVQASAQVTRVQLVSSGPVLRANRLLIVQSVHPGLSVMSWG